MTVYELRKELEKWPQDSRVIFCVGANGGMRHWYEEIQPKDIGPGKEAGTLVLER